MILNPYKALLLLFWFCTIVAVGKNEQHTSKLPKPETKLLSDFGLPDRNRRKRADDGDGFFARPTSNFNTVSLQDELAKVKRELNEFLHNGNVDTTKLDRLMDSVNDLYKQLDDVKIKVDQKISNVSNVVETWLGTVKSLENQVEKAKINATKLDDAQRKHLAECTEELRSRDYPKAERVLNAITNDKRINLLVKDVYAARVGNFDLLLEFANSLSNSSKRFLIYQAMRYEMISNGHNDLVKLIKLYKATGEVHANDTQPFLRLFRESIHEIGAQKLEGSMRNNRKPSGEILAYSDLVDLKSMASVIGNVYAQVKSGDILLFLDDLPERGRLAGYYAMLNRLPSNDELLFALQYRVMELKDHQFARALIFLLRGRGHVIININPKICLGSRHGFYYLYNSPTPSVTMRRTVQGKKVARNQPHQRWTLERTGNYFTITNVEFGGKLVVAEGNRILTTAESLRGNEGYWSVIRLGVDLFWLKSARNWEYLYVTGEAVDRLTRKVSTQVATANSSQWFFDFCYEVRA